MLAVVIVVVVLVGSVGWAAYSRLKVHQREDQIPVVAAAKGLHFAADDPFGSRVVAFPWFRQGDGSRIENVIWSDADHAAGASQARTFDFGWYQLRHDRNGGTHEEWHWSSCAVAEPNGSWPPLQIQQEHLWDKALDLVGGDPIHFESDEFNQTFRVTCDDRRFASALIDPQMMEFLLETKGQISFATMGRHVLLATHQVAPEEMPILLGLADEFVRRVPPAVWELYPRLEPGAPDPALGSEAAATVGASLGSAGDGHDLGDGGGTDDAWDPTPGVDYDLDGHPVEAETEDPWHDHPLRPHDPRPPDRIE